MNVIILLLWGWMFGQDPSLTSREAPVARVYRGPGIVDPLSTRGRWESRGISDGQTVLESHGLWESGR